MEGAHRFADAYLTGNLKVPAGSRVPEAVPRGVFRLKTAEMLGQGTARARATGKRKQIDVKTPILQTTANYPVCIIQHTLYSVLYDSPKRKEGNPIIPLFYCSRNRNSARARCRDEVQSRDF